MPGRIRNHIRAKRYIEAIAESREQLSQNLRDPELLYLLAVAHYFSEDYPEAVLALEQILVGSPGNIDALLLLALICSWGYGSGYLRAPKLYQQVLSLNDKEVDAYIGLAMCRGSPGVQMTLQESIDLLERALSIDPTRRNIHNNLAYAYWEAGKFKNAAEFFRRLLGDSDPETSRVIEERLQQVIDHQKPKNLVYLGPALPRLP